MTEASAQRDPRSVQIADVVKAGTVAGTLRRMPGGVEFSYLETYLGSGAPAVATSLPLSPIAVLAPAGAVPPYFAGLLPEGRRLSALRRAVKTSADDELSLLIAVGADTVGDVQVVPHGERPQAPRPLIEVERRFDEISFDRVLADSGAVDAVALAGVQDKASAGMISVPVSRAGRRYILKVDPPEYPHVVQNEAYLIALARRARFPTVAAAVVHDATGRPGLLVERFDRIPQPDGSTSLLAVEDGAQVLGLYPADKYSVGFEQVAVALADLCAARPVAGRDLFRQLCFAWLTGNGDQHAKNLSVLAMPDGEWRIAPAYDIPSTLPYRDHTLALPVDGRRDGLSRRRLLAVADQLGLTARAAVGVLDAVLEATAPMAEDWLDGAVPFPEQVRRDVARVLRQRRRTASP